MDHYELAERIAEDFAGKDTSTPELLAYYFAPGKGVARSGKNPRLITKIPKGGALSLLTDAIKVLTYEQPERAYPFNGILGTYIMVADGEEGLTGEQIADRMPALQQKMDEDEEKFSQRVLLGTRANAELSESPVYNTVVEQTNKATAELAKAYIAVAKKIDALSLEIAEQVAEDAAREGVEEAKRRAALAEFKQRRLRQVSPNSMWTLELKLGETPLARESLKELQHGRAHQTDFLAGEVEAYTQEVTDIYQRVEENPTPALKALQEKLEMALKVRGKIHRKVRALENEKERVGAEITDKWIDDTLELGEVGL